MKFRRRKASEDVEQDSGLEPEAAPVFEPASQPAGRQGWSTAFLVVGSAMAGATAIALLNRRTIANMRTQIQAQPEPGVSPLREGEEIV